MIFLEKAFLYKYVGNKIVEEDDRKEIYKENKKLLTLWSTATIVSRGWLYKKSYFNEIMITKLYLREQEHTRRIYDKNIPEEFTARIYKKLREKNKKRNEKF